MDIFRLGWLLIIPLSVGPIRSLVVVVVCVSLAVRIEFLPLGLLVCSADDLGPLVSSSRPTVRFALATNEMDSDYAHVNQTKVGVCLDVPTSCLFIVPITLL